MSESQQEKKERAVATYWSLMRAVHELEYLMYRQCGNFGLTTSQYMVLEHVLEFGPMPTGEIAEKLTFGDSTISVVVKHLGHAGLLVRRPHATDKRKVVVHLTAKGEALVRMIRPKRAKVLRAKMCVLGKREQENMERICEKLAKGDPVKFVLEMTRVDEDEERD
ncbi:MAG: winged helix DNA-binding protein [Candidatus Acidoferrales bacterium]|nr:winged helix DNA-binding protein [Candidatus Acidoferrales bacterium]